MAGRQGYSDRDMMRMQQDAVRRVREMQQRARLSTEEVEEYEIPETTASRNNRNWSTNPNVQRRRSRMQQQQREQPRHPEPLPEVPPPPEEIPLPAEPRSEAAVEDILEETEEKEETTLIQDILDAVGIDDDRLLIIGLLFLLINAKADTTLILALMYLLI